MKMLIIKYIGKAKDYSINNLIVKDDKNDKK